jgi:hypothetical protein
LTALRVLFAAATLALAVAGSGCARKPPNATPEGAVREFVERLRRMGSDPTSAKAAYDLLSKATQANLNARAERYSAASGKHIAPEAMIAPSSFIERFEAHELRAEIIGAHARVLAVGLLPGERAEIPCVFEEGGWHVQVELPPLPAVDVRPRDANGRNQGG